MKNLIEKWKDIFKFAPYWESLILTWLLTELIPSSNHILLGIFWLIWWIETYNSYKVKKRLEEILDKNLGKKDLDKRILEKFKEHFCYRQAAISALKNKWTKIDLENFYKILEENKKNADDILDWKYIK